jgi:predicted nucleotidyltransferase
MRQITSSGSVKAIYLDREQVLKELQKIAEEAGQMFPEVREIRLFGSLAKGEHTGLSDIDLYVLTLSQEPNPVERMKPYFQFFAARVPIALDMIVATEYETESFANVLEGSIQLYVRH